MLPGQFTLRISFVLTKDGREDVGNLLKQPSEWSDKFDTLEEAMAFLDATLSKI